MFQALKNWYLGLSPRRRTLFGILVSVIAATIPCYCIGGWALTQAYPAQPAPAVVDTPTSQPVQPTSTPLPSTDTPLPATPTAAPLATATATTTLEPTPTQQPSATPTATETPTDIPTETFTPTHTATPSPAPTSTGTAAPTQTPTETPTPVGMATATSTPPISGTISPLPELILNPSSGPAGTVISITGRHFLPYLPYVLYWDVPELPISQALADDIGQIGPAEYRVPSSASVEMHQVVIEFGGTVIARAPFMVTAGN